MGKLYFPSQNKYLAVTSIILLTFIRNLADWKLAALLKYWPLSRLSALIIMSTLENVLVGLLALLLLFWMLPGAKAALQRSKQQPSDWPSVLMPLAWVAMLIIFLIAMV